MSQERKEIISCENHKERIRTYIYINIENRKLLSHKKEENLAICDNTDKPGGHFVSEISQIEKDKFCMISLISGI